MHISIRFLHSTYCIYILVQIHICHCSASIRHYYRLLFICSCIFCNVHLPIPILQLKCPPNYYPKSWQTAFSTGVIRFQTFNNQQVLINCAFDSVMCLNDHRQAALDRSTTKGRTCGFAQCPTTYYIHKPASLHLRMSTSFTHPYECLPSSDTSTITSTRPTVYSDASSSNSTSALEPHRLLSGSTH